MQVRRHQRKMLRLFVMTVATLAPAICPHVPPERHSDFLRTIEKQPRRGAKPPPTENEPPVEGAASGESQPAGQDISPRAAKPSGEAKT